MELHCGHLLTFEIGAYVSFALGVYSFSLPNTPPKLKGQKSPWETCSVTGIGPDEGSLLFHLHRLLPVPLHSLSFYFQSANGFLKEMGVANSEGF